MRRGRDELTVSYKGQKGEILEEKVRKMNKAADAIVRWEGHQRPRQTADVVLWAQKNYSGKDSFLTQVKQVS